MGLQGKIVFSSGISCDFDIWCFDISSGRLQHLTSGDNLNDYPRFSPDGNSIAYISTQDDLVPSIWIMNSDGSNKKRLTSNIYCQSPSWSPDGTHLIFSGNVGDKNEVDVSIIALDGSLSSTLFTYGGMEQSPSYSPDGKKVIFSAPAKDDGKTIASRDTEVCEYDLTVRKFRVIASHPAKDYSPSISPDGSRIAFVSHRNNKSASDYEVAFNNYKNTLINGTNAEARAAMEQMSRFESDGDIFVMDYSGENLTQLTHDSLHDQGVCWSPCGRFLMYTSVPKVNDGNKRFKIIDAQTGEPVSFNYDRTALEKEITGGTNRNPTLFNKIIPDFIKRQLINVSFWGEERHPHWIR